MVERSVSYLHDSYLNGRTFTGLDDLNSQGRHWLGRIANVRVHASTQARPCNRLLEETLAPCAGLNAYQVAHSTTRTVGVMALVRYEKNDYSVTARWVGTLVTVEAGSNVIVIRARDLIVAGHLVATGPGQRVESPEHVRERWARSVPTAVAPPLNGCHITFTEAVQVRSLDISAEVGAWSVRTTYDLVNVT